jgi:uncharacterized protein YkwD
MRMQFQSADPAPVRARLPRRVAVVVVLVAALAAFLAAEASPTAGVRTSPTLATLQARVLVDLNQIRVAHGLVPLTLNTELSAAAAQHTREMLADGYFAHNSSDGTAFWRRIQRFYPSAQYHFWSVGENLLWSGAPLDANGALAMWMASPEHRANILTPRWREIGVAAESEPNAPGVYGGYDVTVVATDFGIRS